MTIMKMTPDDMADQLASALPAKNYDLENVIISRLFDSPVVAVQTGPDEWITMQITGPHTLERMRSLGLMGEAEASLVRESANFDQPMNDTDFAGEWDL